MCIFANQKSEPIMRPFNLEEALKGARVVTRGGRDVTILTTIKAKQPIVAVVHPRDFDYEDDEDYVTSFFDDGVFFSDRDKSSFDLFLAQ